MYLLTWHIPYRYILFLTGISGDSKPNSICLKKKGNSWVRFKVGLAQPQFQTAVMSPGPGFFFASENLLHTCFVHRWDFPNSDEMAIALNSLTISYSGRARKRISLPGLFKQTPILTNPFVCDIF